MSKLSEIKKEMSRLIGDPTVRKVVRRRMRGLRALRFCMEATADSNWGDSEQ